MPAVSSHPGCALPPPGCRVLALRCALSHYLLQLSADPRSPVLFRCTPSAGGRGGALDAAAGLVPTLFLVKDAMLQVWAFKGIISLYSLWKGFPGVQGQ